MRPASRLRLRSLQRWPQAFAFSKITVRAADAKEVGVENSAEETYHNPDRRHGIQLNYQVNVLPPSQVGEIRRGSKIWN